jgi:hypothetical protein
MNLEHALVGVRVLVHLEDPPPQGVRLRRDRLAGQLGGDGSCLCVRLGLEHRPHGRREDARRAWPDEAPGGLVGRPHTLLRNADRDVDADHLGLDQQRV